MHCQPGKLCMLCCGQTMLQSTAICLSVSNVYVTLCCLDPWLRAVQYTGMSDVKKQRTSADLPQAAERETVQYCTASSDPSCLADDANFDSILKLRNGNGHLLQTPKRSSISRAKALLISPSDAPPCTLTVTGSHWPVAAVVSSSCTCKLLVM